MAGDVKQFNVYLPAELIRELTFAAIDNEQSLSSLVERAIREHLDRSRRRARPRRKPR